jgi:hypothetical protein
MRLAMKHVMARVLERQRLIYMYDLLSLGWSNIEQIS